MSREHDDRIDVRPIDFRWHPPKALSNLKKQRLKEMLEEHRMTPEKWHQKLRST